jgi:hypothetical protein
MKSYRERINEDILVFNYTVVVTTGDVFEAIVAKCEDVKLEIEVHRSSSVSTVTTVSPYDFNTLVGVVKDVAQKILLEGSKKARSAGC